MTTDERPTFLFLHVMKTGGSSLLRHFADNFRPGEVEPDVHDPTTDLRLRYDSINRLRSISASRRRRLRVVAGHVPYFATDLIVPDVTLTVLRDPVERTVSLLRQRKRVRALHDQSLEQIYNDPRVFWPLIYDYQTKLFSLTPEDPLPDAAHMAVIEVDERRLEAAKANLDRVEVVGLHHRYDDFLEEVCRRYGWRVQRDHRVRVAAEDWQISSAFRERITVDNASDIEFFRHATANVELRRRE
jgi:hypothetical protein